MQGTVFLQYKYSILIRAWKPLLLDNVISTKTSCVGPFGHLYWAKTVYRDKFSLTAEFIKWNTVKPVLSSHLKIVKTKVLKTNVNLMKVESIAELEHSAILLTCIKQLLVLKTNFGGVF